MSTNDVNELTKRRLDRVMLREINEEIHQHKEALSEINNEMFRSLREQSNQIGQGIIHTRELQLDALNLKDMATVVNAQGNRLDDVSFQCDYAAFAKVISRKFGNKCILDWKRLGDDISIIFRAVPFFQ